jgi:hypothetical protein
MTPEISSAYDGAATGSNQHVTSTNNAVEALGTRRDWAARVSSVARCHPRGTGRKGRLIEMPAAPLRRHRPRPAAPQRPDVPPVTL